MEVTFGRLFAGIGGIDLGLERAGMVSKWQVEIDDYGTRVLEKHWPNVHRERDICQCGKHNLERVDVIAGGFPCQDISYAGRGAGLDGERSGLFFEAVRLVCELQPRVVILENVAALLARGLDRVLGTLAEIGYDAEWHCIPAAAVGAPHIRDRVFILAYPNSERGRSGYTERKDAENVGELAGRTFGLGGEFDFWDVEPDVGRVANGIPRRVDRLRGLGNAVVPQVAEVVGRIVMERLGETK